jgi:hypothetical protein
MIDEVVVRLVCHHPSPILDRFDAIQQSDIGMETVGSPSEPCIEIRVCYIPVVVLAVEGSEPLMRNRQEVAGATTVDGHTDDRAPDRTVTVLETVNELGRGDEELTKPFGSKTLRSICTEAVAEPCVLSRSGATRQRMLLAAREEGIEIVLKVIGSRRTSSLTERRAKNHNRLCPAL